MPTTGRTEKLLAFTTIGVPTAGALCALSLAALYGVRPLYLGLFAGMYTVTIFGIGMGFHRMTTHRAFKAKNWLRYLLLASGSMAAQGPILFWAAIHRRHHQRTDSPGDPHSPVSDHQSGRTGLSGLWHAHMGWMLQKHDLRFRKVVPDLINDEIVRDIDRAYPIWVVVGLAIPAGIGGIVTGTWAGVGYGLLWGGLFRIFVGHHATWCINSLCHCVGTRRFATPDLSTNNFAMAALTFGEGWHNNHHADPPAARYGIQWWEIDPVYYVVCLGESLNVVWDVRSRKRWIPREGNASVARPRFERRP